MQIGNFYPCTCRACTNVRDYDNIYLTSDQTWGKKRNVLKEIQYGRDSNIVFVTLKTVDCYIFWNETEK